MEKLSERPIREEKVKRLKSKILAEIEEEQAYLKFAMSEYKDHFDAFLEQYYQLMQLKNYIMTEHSFFDYEALSEKDDYIIYQITEKTLDIWLQDDYNFARDFMLRVYDNPWALFDMLNDRYFGYQFTNIFDIIVYDKETGGT